MASEPDPKTRNKLALQVPTESKAEAVMVPLIHSRMAAILKGCGAIGKDRTNTEQKYKFRGIDDVYNELHEVFAQNEVYCLPRVLAHTQTQKTAKSGSVATVTIVEVEFMFIATDGSSVVCKTIGEGADYGDKSTNKAMSTAQKYALFQVFLIPTEGDNDTENQSHDFSGDKSNRQQTQQQQQTQQRQAEPPKVEISADWSTAINDLGSVEQFNTFFAQNKAHFVKAENDTSELTKWKVALWSILTGTAKIKGFEWDKNTAMFVRATKPEAVAA